MALGNNATMPISMSIIANLRAAARVLTGGQSEQKITLTPIAGQIGYRTNNELPQSLLMRQNLGWVYACIRRNAVNVGAMDLHLYKKRGTTKTDWDEVDEDPIMDLLNRPNEQMGRNELFEILSMHEDLTGNAYMYLEGVESDTDVPTALYPLRPDFITPIPGALPEIIVGYRYSNGQTERTFKPYEVIQFRIPSAGNPYQGFGPTNAAFDAIDADAASREWNRSIFQGANPGLLLKTTGFIGEALKTLRQSFEDRHQGRGKQHRVGILPEGVDVAGSGSSQPKDMEFSEQRRQSRDEILAMYGVPAVILGLGLGETMNRASAETLEYVYAKHTVEPKIKRFVGILNVRLVSRYGAEYILDFTSTIPENAEAILNDAKASLGNQPYKSINEVRADMGLAPIKGGDAVMGSGLQVAVGETEDKKGADPKPGLGRKALNFTPTKTKAMIIETKKKVGLEKMADKVFEKIQSARKKALEEELAGDWAPKWEAMIKRMSPEEKTFDKVMREYAEGMGERAQASLKTEVKAVSANDLLNSEDEVSAIIKMTGPVYQSILAKEGKAAAELIGEAFDENDEAVQKSLEKGIKLMAKKYQDETLALLQDALQAGLDEGEGLDGLSKRVSDVTEFSIGTRAERVAKTETFRTANFATREAWKQSEVVSEVKWYTAEDEEVCEFCGPMQGTVVGIEQGFFDKNEEIVGADGGTINTDYAAVENPPLHPNCRCYIRPETINV